MSVTHPELTPSASLIFNHVFSGETFYVEAKKPKYADSVWPSAVSFSWKLCNWKTLFSIFYHPFPAAFVFISPPKTNKKLRICLKILNWIGMQDIIDLVSVDIGLKMKYQKSANTPLSTNKINR